MQYEEHVPIADAIEQGDADEVRDMLTDHMNSFARLSLND